MYLSISIFNTIISSSISVKLKSTLVSTHVFRNQNVFTDTSAEILNNRLDHCPPTNKHDFDMIKPNFNNFDINFGYVLTIANFLVYIPQLYLILKNKTTHGISITTLFIASISMSFFIWSSLILNYNLILSCTAISLDYCFPYIQNFARAFAYLLVMVTVYAISLIIYAMYDTNKEHISPEASKENEHIFGLSRVLFWEMITFTISVVIISAISMTYFYPNGQCNNKTINYAENIDWVVAVLTIAQWLPQIFVTFTFKESGNLSIATLIGLLLINIASVFFDIHHSLNWSIWLPDLIESIFLCSLLMMLLYFYYTVSVLPADKREHHLSNEKIGLLKHGF